MNRTITNGNNSNKIVYGAIAIFMTLFIMLLVSCFASPAEAAQSCSCSDEHNAHETFNVSSYDVTEGCVMEVVHEYLRVRKNASTSSDVVMKLYKGGQVLCDRISGEWARVSVGEAKAWICMKYDGSDYAKLKKEGWVKYSDGYRYLRPGYKVIKSTNTYKTHCNYKAKTSNTNRLVITNVNDGVKKDNGFLWEKE